MVNFDDRVGISSMSLYVPPFRVPLEQWCAWTDNPWEKIQNVVGRSFRVCAPDENVYTMAANAVLRLIQQNSIDPRRIGFLGLGTESSTDNAAGAVIVRGMVDRALDALGLPRLTRNMEVPEFKHACLGGVYALKNAVRYVAFDGVERQAIVVSADVAEYERGSTGEQTQGAGAVAMLVEREPQLLSVDLKHAGNASDYRGPDFRKPFARHFTEGYAERTKRVSDFPIFSGKYSTYAYLDETVHAVEDMLTRQAATHGRYYRDVKALFFHRPYNHMPVQAMSFLYVRGLSRSDHHQQELAELCAEAGVSPEELAVETLSTPDLYQRVLDGAAADDPYRATSQVAASLRRRASFRELLEEKMGLGVECMRDLGNLYTAALPAWIAAGFEDAAEKGLDLNGPIVAVGYGSGDAAEAIPLAAASDWPAAAKRIGFRRALTGAVDLNRQQYEALHDGGKLEDLEYKREGFRIARVGEIYEQGFQDLGVEYYEYV
jgi:hydroxymethylglutaryl-CoA synthase